VVGHHQQQRVVHFSGMDHPTAAGKEVMVYV
jgi:hypothetical protein